MGNISTVNLDTISNWEIYDSFLYKLDQFGRDSVCNAKIGNKTFFNSTFDYDSNNRLNFMDMEVMAYGNSKIVAAHGKLEWLYSDDDRLLEYKKSYFDKSYNAWQTQHKMEYFYSDVKSVEIPVAGKNTDLCIYPNPTSNILHVEGIEQAQEYSIYTMQGCKIQKGIAGDKQINVSELPQGIYLLQFKNSGNNKIFRFVKN